LFALIFTPVNPKIYELFHSILLLTPPIIKLLSPLIVFLFPQRIYEAIPFIILLLVPQRIALHVASCSIVFQDHQTRKEFAQERVLFLP
jgi:hypothetical protein